jgi:hypothetical protein
MARCPFAAWRRLPGSEPAITPRTFIFHTMVGYLTSTDRYFRSGASGGIESHFGVGGKWGTDLPAGLDGVIWQWRDTSEQADANLHANDFAISVETADNAPRSAADLAAWTPKQVAALIRLGRWARATHGIPPRICRTPTDAGFGWHAMWGAPSPWTPSSGKVCPGARRIAQLRTVILPAIFAADAPPVEDDDMTPDQLLDALESDRGKAILRGHIQAELREWGGWRPPAKNDTAVPQTITEAVNGVWGGGIPAALALLRQIRDAVNELRPVA